MNNFSDLLFAYEQRLPIDVALLANAMAAFCVGGRPIDESLAKLMASIINSVGPTNRIEQGRRNIRIKSALSTATLDLGSRSRAHQSIAGSEQVSRERVAKIDQGRTASSALAAFVDGTRSPESIQAAQTAIARIRRRMLSDTGKGRQTRTTLSVVGWGALGRGERDQEIFADVQNLLASGVKPGEALKGVAEHTDLPLAIVKKVFQRMKAIHQVSVEAAALAAGVRPSRLQMALDEPEILGQVGPQNSP